MSMAAGEYVSVSSQSDTEQADLSRERRELAENIDFEREELAQIYVARGLDADLARKVSQQLMAKDALGAHARDELGISEISTARPVQAALTSAATFAVGAAMPLVTVLAFTAQLDHCSGFHRLAGISRPLGRNWCQSRRRKRHESYSSSDILGCTCHGPDCRHRRLGGNERLKGPSNLQD